MSILLVLSALSALAFSSGAVDHEPLYSGSNCKDLTFKLCNVPISNPGDYKVYCRKFNVEGTIDHNGRFQFNWINYATYTFEPNSIINKLRCPLHSMPLQDLLSIIEPINIRGLLIENSTLNGTSLKVHLYNFSVLEELALKNNILEHIPDDLFEHTSYLTWLRMTNNVVRLPREIFYFAPNIQFLNLEKNNLTHLQPDIFKGLTNLKRLYLGSNKLKSLPNDVFFGLFKMEIVKLNENSLTSLPKDTFFNLEYLQHLDLSANNIEYLPEELFKHSKMLKFLKISNNNIMHIPLNLLSELSNLEYLDMRFNKIVELRGDHVHKLSSLKTLNISDNQLKYLYQRNGTDSISAFTKNLNLEELQLANNFMTVVYQDWINNLANLRFLNLSFNKVEYLEITDFEFFSKKDEIVLDLSNNNIKTINLLQTKGLTKNGEGSTDFGVIFRNYPLTSRTINLNNNPFHCDCNLLYFAKFINKNLAPDVRNLYNIPSDSLKCEEPESLKNELLKTISFDKLTCELMNITEINSCPTNCKCQYRLADKGFLIYCQNIGLQLIPSYLSNYEHANHTELYLEGNQLRNVYIPENNGYDNVTYLNLANNSIATIDISSCSRKLKVLDVSNNNLTFISQQNIDFLRHTTGVENILLSGNPWLCNCGAEEFLELIKNKFKQNLKNLTCSDGRHIANLSGSELCPIQNQQAENQLPSSKSILAFSELSYAVAGLLIAAMTIMYYRHHTQIHIYCYSSRWKLLRRLVARPDVDRNKKYDAFISYAHEDEYFVAHHLVPYLEDTEDTKFKICLHYRDFIPGESIAYQIVRSVQSSRRTIVVLSPSFLSSVWGKMEFKTAHEQAMEDGRVRVIAILYEDVGPISELDPELKAYLQVNTYLKWGTPHFWQQLNYALPHPER